MRIEEYDGTLNEKFFVWSLGIDVAYVVFLSWITKALLKKVTECHEAQFLIVKGDGVSIHNSENQNFRESWTIVSETRMKPYPLFLEVDMSAAASHNGLGEIHS